LLIGAISAVLLAGAAFWYTTTDSFRGLVRRRLVAQLESITGGKAEIGGIDIAPFHLRVELSDLTIHGLEKPGEAPFIHIDRLIADLKITSFLHADFGFRYIVLDHPTLHLEIFPDGTTNQPSPAMASEGARGLNQLQQLFSISVNRVDVRHGTLLFGDRKIPVDFSINDFAADTSYSYLHRRYDANVLLGRAQVKLENYQPIAWTAEAHFSVEHNRIEVKSLKVASSAGHAELSGQLQDFQKPHVDVAYTVNLDLARAAAAMRRKDLRSGTLELAGQGSWSPSAYSSSGTLSLDGFGWRDDNVRLANAKLTAKFSLDPHRLALSQLQARLLGGTATGDIVVANWLGPAPDPRTHKNVDPDGVIRLRLTGLSVADIADAFSNPRRPLDRIGLEGSTNGTVEAHWRGKPENLESQLTLDVTAPAQVPPGRLPLDAHAQLTYYGTRDEVQVTSFNANTRFTQLHAAGAISNNSSMRVSATTTDLDELRPLVVAFGGPETLPFRLDGRASFEGTATGKLSALRVGGDLQAADFESTVPATAYTPERKIHWDDFKANVQFSSAALSIRNGELHHDATQISFDFNLGLRKGEATPASPIGGHLEARHADLEEILSLAGYNYPIRGTINLHAQFGGTRVAPIGQGTVEVSDAHAYSTDIHQLTSAWRFSGDQLDLHDLSVIQSDQRLTGAAGYNLSSRAFQFDLVGTNLDLSAIPQLSQQAIAVRGRADFTAKGSGTMREPSLNASIRLRGLTINDHPLGDSTFDAVTQGAELHLTGHSQYQQAQMTTDGAIHLRDDWPSTIKLHFTQVNADPLLSVYIKGRVNSHSSIDGDLLVQGPLLRPRQLRITGDFSKVALGVGEVNIHNDGPVRFSVAGQLLTIEPFHFTGDRTDLTGNGTVQLAGERKLNLHTRGRLSLRLIESLNPEFTTSGILTVDLNVTGTTTDPVPQGRFEIRNGSIAYVDLPSALGEINGALTFNRDRIQIENLAAVTGGGHVQFQGFATTHDRQFSFDVSVHGEDVRLRYPPGISSTANTDLHFVGTTKASTLSGNVTITRLAMSQNFDFASYLASSNRNSTLSGSDPLLSSIRLNVHILTTPELQMQTTMLRLSGNADLQLRGTAANPTLLGRADITEGELYFNGTKYHLERGEVSFRGPSGIQPNLDLQMTTRVRDYDITVSLNGPPDKLKLQYRSEPPLPEADIVSLLALGRTREESAQLQGNSTFGGDASNAILSQALNAAVSSRVQNLFGGSRIKIDPQGLSTETTTSHGPQVTIEQQVTNKLTLTYSTSVSQSAQQQIIQMEYNISRNLSIVAVRDQNGVVSFDVRVRQRKK
jgi:translocation and assembly module TamB